MTIYCFIWIQQLWIVELCATWYNAKNEEDRMEELWIITYVYIETCYIIEVKLQISGDEIHYPNILVKQLFMQIKIQWNL